MRSLHIYALGEPRWVADSGESGRVTLPLLLLLRLLLANNPPTKDEIVEQFWPQQRTTNGRQNLRQALFKIRTQFPHLEVRSDSDHLVVARCGVEVDVIEATQLARNGDPAGALARHQGLFLSGYRVHSVELEHWIDRQRARQAREVRECINQVLLNSPESITRAKKAIDGIQNILPKDPIVYVARSSVHYYDGETSQARWWLNRLPKAAPETVRSYASRLRRQLKYLPKVIKNTSDGTPFVGRVEELSILKTEWAKAEAGQARYVHVAGAVGVGKSRLSHQIGRWAAIRGGRIIQTRASSEKTLARQILDCLRARDHSSDSSTTAKSRHDNERSAAIDAVERESTNHPVLLVVDDLQYLSGSATRVLRELRSSSSSLRLLVLHVGRAVSDTVRLPGDRVIQLNRLSDGEVDKLLTTAKPAIRVADHRRAIVVSAEGNPLLAKRYANLIVSAQDTQLALAAIRRRDRRVLYEALLRGQGRERRRVVEVIAVARGALRVACLRDITGLHSAELRTHLAALAAEGVVRWEGGTVGISRDYDSREIATLIPKNRRRRYHRLLARSFVGRGAKYLHVIAYHLDAAADYRAAFSYYLKAARSQLRSTKRETVEGFLKRAAEIGEVQQFPRFRLEALQADYHYEWEEYGLAAPLYRSLLREPSRLTSRAYLRCRIRYLRSAASIGTQRSGYNTQKVLLVNAQRLGDPELELEAAYAAFARLSDTAKRDEYRQLAGEFWRLSRRWPDEVVAARALCQAALLYLGGARPELAAQTAQFAMKKSSGISAEVEFEAHVVSATVDICRGDLIAASDHIRAAEAIKSVLPRVPRRKLWGVNLGVYYLERGDWLRAEELFLDLFEEYARKGGGSSNVVVATNLAILYYEKQRFADALKFASIARALDAPIPGDSTPAHAVEGLIYWREGNTSRAVEKAAHIANGGAYFGDHSYAEILKARLRGGQAPGEAAAALKGESARWKRLYYPGSLRMELEALCLSETRLPDQVRAIAMDAYRRGLLPVYMRARDIVGSS